MSYELVEYKDDMSRVAFDFKVQGNSKLQLDLIAFFANPIILWKSGKKHLEQLHYFPESVARNIEQ